MAIAEHLGVLTICLGLPLFAATSPADNGLRQVAAVRQRGMQFDRNEVRLSDPTGGIRFHLTGYGYGERLIKPAAGMLSANADRLEYQRGDLIEWYVNGSQGLEQGFTLARRPAAGNRGHEPLVIAIAVTGDLRPVASDNAVEFASNEGVVFRYRGLRVWDARGRHLTSRLEVRGRELRLIVDDRHAEYPVTIDPARPQQ